MDLPVRENESISLCLLGNARDWRPLERQRKRRAHILDSLLPIISVYFKPADEGNVCLSSSFVNQLSV